MKSLAALTVVAALVLSGCGGGGDDDPTVEPSWNLPFGDSTDLRKTIDEYGAAIDCDGLQATFDIWADAKPFDDQSDVVTYIDDKMREVGCYK